MTSLRATPCQHDRCMYCADQTLCCECEDIEGCTEWTCIYHGHDNRMRVERHRELT